MKRIPFKEEFQRDILSGTKRHTSRWKCTWKVGDICAAVSAKNGKPAFLTPAAEAFATLKITSVKSMFWKDFTEDHANLCGVTRDWYMKQMPNAQELDRLHLIEFKVVK